MMYDSQDGGIDAATGVEMEEVAAPATRPADVEVLTDVPDVAAPGDLTISGKPEVIRRWVDAAAQFSRCQVAASVMAGLGLIEAKKAGGWVQGGVRGDAQDRPAETWEEFCTEQVGISADTARNWMRMAEAVKPRLRKLNGVGALMRDILAKPVSQLTENQQRLLTDAVHKVADGRGQMEFLAELGLAKKAQGAAAKGGDTGGAASGAARSPDALRLVAEADWQAVVQKLRLARANFTLLDELALTAVSTAMEDSLAAIKEWMALPKSERTADVVKELERRLA